VSREDTVWITGLGAATPLGNSFDDIAGGLLEGRSGISTVRGFSVTDHPSQIAGQVGGIPCPASHSAAEFSAREPLEQLVLWCCESALRDAGWWDRRSSIRLGLVLGIGAEWLITWESEALKAGLKTGGPRADAASVVIHAQRELGLCGPTLGLSAACASGNHALARARSWLELGWVDVCLAGACDMAVTPMSLACFGNLRALSRKNAEPPAASRPFDKGRDGFVIGEGGAVFVLERSTNARRRGARAYAAVSGCGASSDAYHAVIPSPDPEQAVAAMQQALHDARAMPEDVDYVNAHATGTPVGDVIEARALKSVLGEATSQVPVSSTKSMTGHLLTAAGAMECLACMVALDRQALPPTINLDDPDPECDLLHVRNEAQPHPVEVTVSNSFGFGGSNTCLVLRSV
jgi:3-oxoacyl-[acyl-carrier-protein] synthase II